MGRTMIVEFPTVVKMQISTQIEVKKNNTFEEIKNKIFTIFWKTIKSISHIPKHGDSSQVILKNRNNCEISTMDELKESLKISSNFIAVFKKHPTVNSTNTTDKKNIQV